jgi:hypothetical protein
LKIAIEYEEVPQMDLLFIIIICFCQRMGIIASGGHTVYVVVSIFCMMNVFEGITMIDVIGYR